jgi:4-amino-4-deoxy-L-arabinose transferase-like glycosyltransferase
MQNEQRIRRGIVPSVGSSFCILLSAFCLLLPLCGFLFFYRLADRDLWSSHEARAAMDARSILDGTAVLVPQLFDGRSELQKPPLYYWMVAACGTLRGSMIDSRDVRLPAALSASGCVLALAWFGWFVGRGRMGLYAAVILATAAHFTWLARIGRIDMPLTLTTALSAIAAFLAIRQGANGSRCGLLVAYLAAASGVLLKGPIGFILPAAALTAYLLAEGQWPAIWEIGDWLKLIRRLGLHWGLPLVLVLTLPWFLAADEDTGGELFRVFFWHHNVDRALGGSELRTNPWWFYGPQFIGDFLPWSPLVIGALVLAWRCGWLRDDPLARFGLAWFVGIFCVLSCSGFKRGDYLLPAYPGAAIFLSCVLVRIGESTRYRWASCLVPASLAIGMACFWAFRLEVSLPGEEPMRDYRPMAKIIRTEAPAPEEIVFFRTEAHALAFRVGRPLTILVEWSDLASRLSLPGTHYVVTPPDSAAECRRLLPGLSWSEVSSTVALAGGKHERPLLLLRATSPSGFVARKP